MWNRTRGYITISLFIIMSITSLLSAQSADAIDIEQLIDYDKGYFINPVGHKMVLAGSFGELRTNHFHSGLDIKPQKYNTSEPILTAANGYVSRVKIQRGGYGRALYISHPNGYTTVYAHLAKFSDDLEQYIEKMQYKLESFEVDIYPQPHELSVTQGQIIGMMGTSGRSYGVHLHFEIRETQSEIPVNPMLFGHGPEDHKLPLINSLSIHALDPDKVVLKKQNFQTKYKGKGVYTLNNKTISFPAWNIGLAVHSFDKMDGGKNTNGIYSLKMFVDDSLYYGFEMDRISFSETNMINAHIDYENKIKKNSTYQLCYQLPGNTLSIYNQKGDGTIKLYKNKSRQIKIIVEDLAGNISTLDFNILRDPNIKAIERPEYNFIVDYKEADTLRFGNVEAIIPLHALYKKYYLSCESGIDSDHFSIGTNALPLRKSCIVNIKSLPNDSLSNKRCITVKKDKNWISYGGVWDGSILSARIRQFGKFKVTIDNTKPTIKAVKFPTKIKNNQTLQLKVYDNLQTKGSAKSLSINVHIDGKWILYEYKSMTKIVTINLPKNILKGKHDFVLSATDDRGNTKEYRKTFQVI